MKIRVLVSYKDSVLDPQGQTVKNALHTLGYDAIQDVRQGKVFELEFKDMTARTIGKDHSRDLKQGAGQSHHRKIRLADPHMKTQ